MVFFFSLVSLLPTEQCKCIWILQGKRTMFKDRDSTSLSPSLLTPTRLTIREPSSAGVETLKAFYSCEFFFLELII